MDAFRLVGRLLVANEPKQQWQCSQRRHHPDVQRASPRCKQEGIASLAARDVTEDADVALLRHSTWPRLVMT